MAALPATADCVIVGGGAVGCSVAFHLARRGMRPLLLERGELGSGSTGRCAGGVRQQFSTDVNVRMGILSRRLLERFEADTGHSADFRQIGYLLIATTDEMEGVFRSNLAVQRAAGLDDVRELTRDEVAAMLPGVRTDDVRLGAFCPTDGLAGPNEMTQGYARAARALGATVLENVEVTAIDRDGDAVAAVVAGGTRVETSLVVDCAGPYAAPVAALAGVTVPVDPHKRHIFTTEAFALPSTPPFVVDLATTLYFHPEGDGLLLGMSDHGDAPTFDTGTDWSFLERIVAEASHRIPAIEQATIRTGWAGLYEVTPDNQAIIGESELRGLWLCCGFSGHGFMQAPAAGLLLAQRITGEPTEIDITTFSPQRFARGEAKARETAVI